MTEAALLEAVKKLAVKEESKLAHRIKMIRAVGGEAPVAAAVTPKRGAGQCLGWDASDHGGRSQRLSDFPAMPCPHL